MKGYSLRWFIKGNDRVKIGKSVIILIEIEKPKLLKLNDYYDLNRISADYSSLDRSSLARTSVKLVV
jgi:hypothetical protein